MGPGGRRVVRPTPRLAVVWELGSDLWPPVSFSEHTNLQHLPSRLVGKTENKAAPSLLGLRSRKVVVERVIAQGLTRSPDS